MIFNICNTAGWGKLNKKYYETLKPFSLKISENDDATIELNTLQDIIDLKEKVDEDIIITGSGIGTSLNGGNPTIEIYDTWRE